MRKVIKAGKGPGSGQGSSFSREMHGEIGRDAAKEVLSKAEDVQYALDGIIKQAKGSAGRYGSATGIGRDCVNELYDIIQKYELI